MIELNNLNHQSHNDLAVLNEKSDHTHNVQSNMDADAKHHHQLNHDSMNKNDVNKMKEKCETDTHDANIFTSISNQYNTDEANNSKPMDKKIQEDNEEEQVHFNEHV